MFNEYIMITDLMFHQDNICVGFSNLVFSMTKNHHEISVILKDFIFSQYIHLHFTTHRYSNVSFELQLYRYD